MILLCVLWLICLLSGAALTAIVVVSVLYAVIQTIEYKKAAFALLGICLTFLLSVISLFFVYN